MGFLKRLLSLGGKKNKKDSRPQIVHNVPVPELPWSQVQDAPIISNEEEHEAAVGRLLRSTSARFAESTELNYAHLPPLPHPINNVIQTPASSSLSIASTTLTRQGTYNVTVHKRRRHASTEVPVPPLPNSTNHDNDISKPANKKRKSLLTADDSRIQRLRSDPSVASLIDLYDDHGKLAADVFSNETPREKAMPKSKSAPTTMNMRSQPKVEPLRIDHGDDDGCRERAQVKRSGSTLRQLLGASTNSDSNNAADNSGSGEGDISWAERFLAETESTSSHSSIGLETPITTHSTHFYTEPLKGGSDDSTDLDVSTATIDNPAISSMEVEVSASEIPDMDDDESMNGDTVKMGLPAASATASATPRRASQVFDFLTKGRQSTTVEQVVEDMNTQNARKSVNMDRTLPELPSCFSSPSSDDHGHQQQHSQSTGRSKIVDPPVFTFTPTITEDVHVNNTRGLQVNLPALPDNTPRPIRHHHRSNSANVNTHSDSHATSSANYHHGGRGSHGRGHSHDYMSTRRSESRDLRSAFSDDSHMDTGMDSFATASVPFTPLANRERVPLHTGYPRDSIMEGDETAAALDTTLAAAVPEKKQNDIKVMLNGPTKVIVTAPTPGFNPSGPGRLPRGPRALPKRTSGPSLSSANSAGATAVLERRRSALVERSNSHSPSSSTAGVMSAWSPARLARNRSGSQSSNSGSGSGSGSGGAGGVANMSISDPFSLGHPRRRANTSNAQAAAAMQRVRSPSNSSLNSFTRALKGEREDRGYTIREKEKEKERLRARQQEREKENHGRGGYDDTAARTKRSRSPLELAKGTLGLSVKTDLPSTPMRSSQSSSSSSNSRGALLKTVVQQAIAFHPPLPQTTSPSRYDRHDHHHHQQQQQQRRRNYEQDEDDGYDREEPRTTSTTGTKHLQTRRTRTPSPASSSEMSPVGRQMMLDVRQQRLNARQAERERAATRRGGSERRAYGV